MKKYIYLTGMIILVCCVVFFNPGPGYQDCSSINNKAFAPSEYFFMQRAFPFASINHEAYKTGLLQAQKLRNDKTYPDFDHLWEFAGPLNIGGRLTDVEIHPSDVQKIFIGAASGGVFRSENGGSTWTPVFDDALSLSIGDICIAPSDPDVIYVGTGEANCGGGSVAYDGLGLYKSSDGGDTWQFIGLEESRNVGRIAVHPQNPDIVYVAAMGNLFSDTPGRGVYKSADGGLTWNNVLYLNDSTGAVDIMINPGNPDTVYAAMWERVRRPDRRSYGGPSCGIYRTVDGGTNWVELTNGLPSNTNNVGRIGFDLCASQPHVMYAIYADKTGYFLALYKSTDYGNSWQQTNDASLDDCYSSYGWWFGRVKADPVDPNIAYVIGFTLHKTSNGGSSYSDITGSIHVDQHEVFINPGNHNEIFVGNDGGLYKSTNGGNSFTWINNLPITQFYTSDIDFQYPERLYGGTQDNGTNRTMAGGTDDWESIFWGDGFYVLVNPENNNYIYAEYQYGNFARSTDGGTTFYSAMNGISGSDRKNWNTPVVFDPSDPATLYFGANRLYKTINNAQNWTVISPDLTNGPSSSNVVYGTITTISVSPLNPQIIYCGTDDGNVWVTINGGQEWVNISSGLPDRWITRVLADPFQEMSAFVTLSGYRNDEYLPHVFRTENTGNDWTDISSNLPELPVNDILVDPIFPSTYYVANDGGVFITRNAGLSWSAQGTNLPNCPVCDLSIHGPARKLIAATYGRSIYSYNLYQDSVFTFTGQYFSDESVLKVSPNPSGSVFNIRTFFHKSQDVNIWIAGINGKMIKSLHSGPAVNTGNYEWTGDTGNGVPAPDGVYFVFASNGKERYCRKIILLR